jgi:hypothetical protein
MAILNTDCSFYPHQLNTKEVAMIPFPQGKVRFEYLDHNHKTACCWIEAIPLTDGRVAVIATETADNPGMSITNATELVAAAVCKLLHIPSSDLVLIEHYDPHSYHHSKPAETFDLVTFDSTGLDGNAVFVTPNWRRMTVMDWLDLGIAPR